MSFGTQVTLLANTVLPVAVIPFTTGSAIDCDKYSSMDAILDVTAGFGAIGTLHLEIQTNINSYWVSIASFDMPFIPQTRVLWNVGESDGSTTVVEEAFTQGTLSLPFAIKRSGPLGTQVRFAYQSDGIILGGTFSVVGILKDNLHTQ